MNWKKVLKPTKRKIAIALIPFIFPATQLFVELELETDIVPRSITKITYIPEMIIMGTEIFISTPFEPLLEPFGWWSRDSFIIGPDGPLLPGSFVIAITYGLIIYMYLSLEPHTKFKKTKK